MARVVSVHPRSANAYRVTLEFFLPGDSSPTHATRELPASILYRPANPGFVLILSYPGADWLPPAVLFAFASLFALVWRITRASSR